MAHDGNVPPQKEMFSMSSPKTEPEATPANDQTSKPAAAKTQPHTARRVRKPSAHKSQMPGPRPGTRTPKILRLLKRPNGASLRELTKATGWQPHSVRGFLSGAVKAKMRLKLTSLQREDGERAYRLPAQ